VRGRQSARRRVCIGAIRANAIDPGIGITRLGTGYGLPVNRTRCAELVVASHGQHANHLDKAFGSRLS
jgi:hypothetical protein